MQTQGINTKVRVKARFNDNIGDYAYDLEKLGKPTFWVPDGWFTVARNKDRHVASAWCKHYGVQVEIAEK